LTSCYYSTGTDHGQYRGMVIFRAMKHETTAFKAASVEPASQRDPHRSR
jgi:hypothetical protein